MPVMQGAASFPRSSLTSFRVNAVRNRLALGFRSQFAAGVSVPFGLDEPFWTLWKLTGMRGSIAGASKRKMMAVYVDCLWTTLADCSW